MLVDKEFGKYTIEKELGKGGMATVYLALHRDLNRRVAIKVMHPHLASEAPFRTRFEMEARAIAQLEHINILQVYDFGKEGEYLYFSMELVDGVDAERLVKKNGAIPPEITAIIFYGIANGLYQAHLKNIIHRDIKLSNIIVKKDGVVKLSDFGIAKMEEGGGRLTQTNSIVGTPYYLSPEQVEGVSPTFKSDIYALGVSMYYAVTGKYPINATSFPAILSEISKGQLIPLKYTGVYVPDELAVIIEKALSKNPNDRYESSAGLAQDLNAFLYKNEMQNDSREVEKYLENSAGYTHERKKQNITTKIQRGRMFQEKGLVFEALREYESVLTLDPENEEVRANILRLNESGTVKKEETHVGLETMIMPKKSRRGRKILWSALGLLAAGVLAGGAYFISATESAPTSAPPENKPDTVMTAAVPAPAPVPAAATLAPPPEPRPAPKAKKKSSAPAAAAHPAAVETPKVALAPPPEAPKVQKPCSGFIFVFSEIWGSLSLNGQKFGNSPTKNKIEIPCGDYDLTVENPDGRKYSGRVSVKEAATTRLQVKAGDFQ